MKDPYPPFMSINLGGGGVIKKIPGSILKLRIIDSDWTGGTHLKKTVLVDRILLARDSFLFCY